MEDLADEFREDFLLTVKTLEDYSGTHATIRESLREVRAKVEGSKYTSAPNFWEDLRERLGAIASQGGDDKGNKSKVQQMVKQISRLEVKFWAKESTSMLQDLDPEFRLERLVDWIQTFEASTDSSDLASGPAVLYTVVNDMNLQRDLDITQKEQLQTAIKENLHKFPYEMQAVLERVGSVQSGGVTARIVNDWRRRNQPAVQEQPASTAPSMSFPQAPQPNAGAAVSTNSQNAASGHAGSIEDAAHQAGGEAEVGADDEDAAVAEPFNVKDVPPEVMGRARQTVLAMLASNAGECPKNFVRNILKQVGIAGCPIAALGAEIFFSGAEVFLRRQGAPTSQPAAPPPNRTPVPEELKQQIVALVSESGGRLLLSQMAERLQWSPGSIRHEVHGPLRRAVAQVVELFFEPNKVFLLEAARHYLAILAPPEEDVVVLDPVQQEQVAEVAAAPYVADPFAEMLATIMAWLQQAEGALESEPVLQLIKELGFKNRAVITALSHQVFWSHPEAECEILLRTAGGAAQHPKPLPDVYLHEIVHRDIINKLREMGHKAKLDKLAGILGWNMKSELRKAYGQLRIVIQGLREVFYDPQRMYLKTSLDGVVEWPVSKEGRLGPQASQDVPIMHWTPAADDPKATGDPEWLNIKRQLLGTVMGHSGQCEVAILRQLLAGLDNGSVELEIIFKPGSPRDLSKVLFWSHDYVCIRQPKAVEATKAQNPTEEHMSADVKQVIVNSVRSKGRISLAELRVALDEAKLSVKVDDNLLFHAVQRIPEVFFMPEVVFMRHLLKNIISEVPATGSQGDSPEELAAKSEQRAAKLAAEADYSEDVAMQALAEAASALTDEAPADSDGDQATQDAGSGGAGFFSFTSFEKQPENIGLGQATKRRKVDAGDGALPLAWGTELPPWVTEGAAVSLRKESAAADDEVGVIMQVTGTIASIRLLIGETGSLTGRGGAAGGGFGKEMDVPTSQLVPIAPKVGATVKVVSGRSQGAFGKLTGITGTSGIVQIGSLNYETLPLNQLAVLAQWR